MAAPVRLASADLAVTLMGIAEQGSDGTLVEDPGWREYIMEIENLSTNVLTVQNVKLLNQTGRYVDSALAYDQITAPPDVNAGLAGDVAGKSGGHGCVTVRSLRRDNLQRALRRLDGLVCRGKGKGKTRLHAPRAEKCRARARRQGRRQRFPAEHPEPQGARGGLYPKRHDQPHGNTAAVPGTLMAAIRLKSSECRPR